MGPKRETLLRWVNCTQSVNYEKIGQLKTGAFFVDVLSAGTDCEGDKGAWFRMAEFFRKENLRCDLVDLKAASEGDDVEISKLVALTMHVTMVLKPSEVIKSLTMNSLSNEEQMVIKSILHTIVSNDHITAYELAEVVSDPFQGTVFYPYLRLWSNLVLCIS